METKTKQSGGFRLMMATRMTGASAKTRSSGGTLNLTIAAENPYAEHQQGNDRSAASLGGREASHGEASRRSHTKS